MAPGLKLFLKRNCVSCRITWLYLNQVCIKIEKNDSFLNIFLSQLVFRNIIHVHFWCFVTSPFSRLINVSCLNKVFQFFIIKLLIYIGHAAYRET